MLDTMTVNTDRLNETVHQDFSNATELADYLVAKDVPFRKAHESIGKIVFECIQQGIYLLDVPLERYKELNSNIVKMFMIILNRKTVLAEEKVMVQQAKTQYVIN